MAGQRSRTRKIDNLRWIVVSDTALALSAGSIGALVLNAQTLPETIMRLRGSLLCFIDGFQAPGVLGLISVGLHVVPGGTGAMVTARPFSEGNADWFFHTMFYIGYEEAVTDVVDVPVVSAYRERIDGKAMRRLKSDDEVQLVVENTTLGAAVNVNLVMATRFLMGK